MPPAPISAGETATLVTYTHCRSGDAEVTLWRFTGSGHVWPGALFNTGPPSTWILAGVGRGSYWSTPTRRCGSSSSATRSPRSAVAAHSSSPDVGAFERAVTLTARARIGLDRGRRAGVHEGDAHDARNSGDGLLGLGESDELRSRSRARPTKATIASPMANTAATTQLSMTPAVDDPAVDDPADVSPGRSSARRSGLPR